MLIKRGFSLTSFVIASSALGFQVFVMYPRHLRLDADFEALKKEYLQVLHDGKADHHNELARDSRSAGSD